MLFSLIFVVNISINRIKTYSYHTFYFYIISYYQHILSLICTFNFFACSNNRSRVKRKQKQKQALAVNQWNIFTHIKGVATHTHRAISNCLKKNFIQNFKHVLILYIKVSKIN